MAKQPNSQTIESYQSSLAEQIKNSTGLEKATNSAILSKTYRDDNIKKLQKEIALEKEQLEIQKQYLSNLKKANASSEVLRESKKKIAEHEKVINKLNKEGITYLENTVNSIRDITSTYKVQIEYQEASLNKKLEMKQAEADELKSRLETLNVLRQEGKLTADMQKERAELEKKYEDSKNRQISLQKSISEQEEKYMTYAQKRAAQEERIKNAREKLKEITIERDAILNDKNATDEEKGSAINKYNKLYKNVSGTLKNNAYEQAALRFFTATGAKFDKITSGVDKINKGLSSLTSALDAKINEAMAVYTQYMGSIDARLYGTNLTFSKMQKDINNTLGSSRFVSQQKMIENLNKLTESGIAFNLEYRAWLETVSDKMVTTFNSLDSTLTRLVRLQQADISNASLGAEALMTKFLNSQFKDTSYLNNMYDTVAGLLIDSTSQQNATNSIGYQFAVQKWLGALSSVGLSDSAVSSIAQALNWLGSGNVNQLNSNTQASTLLNLSAQKAGLSYADMLLNGTNADNINKLMKAMVVQLQDISRNTKGNQVVKSAWGDILNFTMSDIRAINNLTTEDISSIYNTEANYKTSISELNSQTNYISKRTSVAEQIDNVIQNTLFGIGADMASSPTRYIGWKAGKLISSVGDMIDGGGWLSSLIGGGIKLGGKLTMLATALGPAVDQLYNLASNGISQTGNGAIGNGFGFKLYQSRGQGFTGVGGVEGGKSAVSTQKGTSYSGVASTASDVGGSASVNLAGNVEKKQSSVVTSKQTSGKDADAIYSMLFEKQTKSIKVNVVKLSSSIIDDIAQAMHVEKIDSIDEKLSGTISTTVENYSDVFANTASTIQYVQGL